MAGLILKLVICPIAILISNYLFGLQYTPATAIVVGLVIAVAAHMMEILILKRGTFWISTIADFVAAFAIVYFSQFFIVNVYITVWDALLTSALLTVTEYFQHNYLIKSGRTKKKGA